MSVVKSFAEKRHSQSLKKRIRNKIVKAEARTYIKKFNEAFLKKDLGVLDGLILKVIKTLDSAAQKKVYHKNTAARVKSRLQKKLNNLKTQ